MSSLSVRDPPRLSSSHSGPGSPRKQYASLSALAPTVAYPEKASTIDWKDQIATGDVGVFLPSEQWVAMVANMGLKVDPFVGEMTKNEKEGTDSATFSIENVDKLNDIDLLFTFYSDAANRAEMEALPPYGAVTAIRRGAVLAPTETPSSPVPPPSTRSPCRGPSTAMCR